MSEVNKQQPKPFLQSFTQIFYTCKILGIYPYDFHKFYYQGILQGSRTSCCVVIAVIFIIFVLFNITLFTFGDQHVVAKYNHLNLIINVVFTYMTPIAMFTDEITAMRNQKLLPKLFARIDYVDEDLGQLGITVNNKRVYRRIWLMIVLTFVCEFYMFFAMMWLIVDEFEWFNVLWIFTSIPTIYNSLDKIWFLGILLGLRDRFEAINTALDDVTEEIEKNNLQKRKGLVYEQSVGVGELMLHTSLSVGSERISDIKLERLVCNAFGELVCERESNKSAAVIVSYENSSYNFAALQERFISLCQLHDSICRIAQQLNQLWAYPLLVLMAFGFVFITSLLYFAYCATWNQSIPLIFSPAKNIYTSFIVIGYIAGKCVSLMFFSWQTTQASRRAGICLHKCGVAADTNEVYEIVNHLSLKLLNHDINFSACGFFKLDMGTLYAVCGAITSYLIILIQFNMAGEQVRISKELAAANESTALTLAAENYTVMPLQTTMEVH